MSAESLAFYMHDLSGGGVERMRLALIAELRARGHAVTLILGRRQGALVALLPVDLPVIELGRTGMLQSVPPLARALRRVRPRILVASLDHNNVTAMLAGWCARAGTRVVICQHNALSAERASGWRYRAVPWLYWLLQSRAHGIVAVSQGVAVDMARVSGIPPGRITPIYNPVIAPGFADRHAGPPPHPWLADPEVPALIFAGRLTAQKDPGLLLDALALLAAGRRARLIVLGDGPLLPGLQAKAASLGLAGMVLFAGFQADPVPWIAGAACLILPSRYEGLGNVLIEALACGTPVVATDCPYGPSEILLGGRFGALVPVGDAAAMAAALARTLDAPPDPASLRARALSFTAAACADAHQALFARIIAAPRAFGLPLSPLSAPAIAGRVVTEPACALRVIVTPNINHIRLLRRPAFRAAYDAADLVTPDGFPVLLHGRLRGLALPGRVTGCDIYSQVADHPGLAARRVLVVTESATTEAALTHWGRARGLGSLAVITAPAGLAQDRLAQAAMARAIAQAAPDILVMTLGAPVSEVFLHEHRSLLPPCWALCVGQAVRVHLGLMPRAPSGWQAWGMEWLWRVCREPRRLVLRYVRDVAWFPAAVLQDLVGR